ncbi:MAG: hypothetical protein ACK4SY_09655 [Pyrobaculum sp.]
MAQTQDIQAQDIWQLVRLYMPQALFCTELIGVILNDYYYGSKENEHVGIVVTDGVEVKDAEYITSLTCREYRHTVSDLDAKCEKELLIYVKPQRLVEAAASVATFMLDTKEEVVYKAFLHMAERKKYKLLSYVVTVLGIASGPWIRPEEDSIFWRAVNAVKKYA